MTAVIFDPLEEFEKKYRASHQENTNAFFQALVKRSGVNVAENRKTVTKYNVYKEALMKLRRKKNWLCFWRILMCITLALIPLVIMKITPRIRELRQEIRESDAKATELMALAQRQMEPLNRLFTDRDALDIIHKTIPLMCFYPYFSAEQEDDMKTNYDFRDDASPERSTIDVLAGAYNENPFLFENRRVHTMGTETYHGYKTITWTETYRDSNGNMQRRTCSETLHATVVKPKPFYSTQVVLRYCAQGGPDLSFSRDATNLDRKSERQIERYVKRGGRKLNRKNNKAIKKDSDFMSMSNTEFEVLFDALDRDNEVQFRTLFTPLAQTNMVSLLLSKVGFGDDFNFIKEKRTNTIITQHSQGRVINLFPREYISYSYDIIAQNFIHKNTEFFKAVYFDFAPLLAIPVYQERPVHSLKPIPDYARISALKEGEALANMVPHEYVVHPSTKTPAILKSAYVKTKNNADEISVTALSYDIEGRVEVVPVWGGDGRMHGVPVPWDAYLPLTAQNSFLISADDMKNRTPLAKRNGLSIYGA